MDIRDFVNEIGSDFYAGVPDSQLKALCDYLMVEYGTDAAHHVVAANEGNAVGLAAGYYMATGKVPVVYMQNSGEGNAINPITSLLNDEVYGIPVLFIIGWRGEPGIHDEPQHVFQGQITCSLLDELDIAYEIVDANTTIEGVAEAMNRFRELFDQGKSTAFVIRKKALSFDEKPDCGNSNEMVREKAIEVILDVAGDVPIVSTTGKPSRELFEIREGKGQPHDSDFLTVGSMGHASSIALGIAAQKPDSTIWCIDGDGAALMHMGAMAVIGASGAMNLVHVVLDNGAHETVGGVPTASRGIDLVGIAKACGYASAVRTSSYEDLRRELVAAKESVAGPQMIVADVALGSRSDLGRPTVSPQDAKNAFMGYLKQLR